MGQVFYGHGDLLKVKTTMARLLTIVNERKKLRSEYRKQLENEFIAYQKAEEAKAYKEEIEALKQ